MTAFALLKQDTERLREAIDAIAVIGEYVALRRSGSGRPIGLCPFHKEKTPSFTVNVARKRFKCFGCGVGGDVFEFVQRIEGIDFRRAKALLASRAGTPLENRRMTPSERRVYCRASAGADTLARRLADFANGLCIVTERNLVALSHASEVTSIASTETLATMHRQSHQFRFASPRDIADLWRAMPTDAAKLERVGYEDRQNAEAITMAIVNMLTTVQRSETVA